MNDDKDRTRSRAFDLHCELLKNRIKTNLSKFGSSLRVIFTNCFVLMDLRCVVLHKKYTAAWKHPPTVAKATYSSIFCQSTSDSNFLNAGGGFICNSWSVFSSSLPPRCLGNSVADLLYEGLLSVSLVSLLFSTDILANQSCLFLLSSAGVAIWEYKGLGTFNCSDVAENYWRYSSQMKEESSN